MLEVSIINNPFKNPSALGKLSEGVSAIGRQQKQVSASILNNGSELSAVVKAMDKQIAIGRVKELNQCTATKYKDLSASMRMMSDNMTY